MNYEIEDRAREQAAAQADNITAMLERRDHAYSCRWEGDPGSCDAHLGAATIGELDFFDPLRDYHEGESAQEDIDQSPLSVEIRSGWTAPWAECEPYEFRIVLCTGGPAVQIRGTIGVNGEPDTAWLEYQDWGTPWVQYTDDPGIHRDEVLSDTLREYSRCFIGGTKSPGWFGERR